MIIYLFAVICIGLFDLFLQPALGAENNQRKKIFCFFCAIVLILIMGLRDYSLGQNDVISNYVPMYKQLHNMTMSQVINHYNGKDVLFFIITKLFSMLFPNPHFWLFSLSMLNIIPISILISKESKLPALSFMMYLGYGYYGYCFTILRHAMALSFIVIGYLLFRHSTIKGIILSILFWLIAVGFHSSAIVFGLFYLLHISKIKSIIRRNYLILIIASLVISQFFKFRVIQLLLSVGSERINIYEKTNTISSFNNTMYFIHVGLFILAMLCYWFEKYKVKRDTNVSIDYSLFTLTLFNICILSFNTTWALSFRVAMFFGIFSIVSLPNIINKCTDIKIAGSVYYSTYIFLILYFLMISINRTFINPYHTFF